MECLVTSLFSEDSSEKKPCTFCFPVRFHSGQPFRASSFRERAVTPVAGSNLLEQTSPNSPQNSNPEKKIQSKPRKPMKWTQLISADFSFKFSTFYNTSTSGLFLVIFFLGKNLSNVWGIYESTPHPQGMITVKRISRDWRFPRFEISQEKYG